MDVFNAPTREHCTIRRERTNTPLQALVTLNDPRFVEAARFLAQEAIEEMGGDLDRRLDYMTMRVMARPLEGKEREVAKHCLRRFFCVTIEPTAKKPRDCSRPANPSPTKSCRLWNRRR